MRMPRYVEPQIRYTPTSDNGTSTRVDSSAWVGADSSAIAFISLLRQVFRGKFCRCLSKYITPPLRGARVSIAEPELVVVRGVLVTALDPEQRGHDRRIAPHAHRLVRVFLMLVGLGLVARRAHQVGLR